MSLQSLLVQLESQAVCSAQDITYDKDGDTMKASASSSFDIWCLCKCLPCHRHQMALSIPASTKSLWSSDAKRFTPHNSSEC